MMKDQSALQCVAVCCSALQCVAVRCSVLHLLQCVEVVAVELLKGNVQRSIYVAVCCSALQCVAVRCSVAVGRWKSTSKDQSVLQYVAVCRSVLQYDVVLQLLQ